MTRYGRIKREVRENFRAVDQFYEQVDQAHANARPAALRGRRLRSAVANAFGEVEAADQAEESARDLAVSTLMALAKSYKRQERRQESEPAAGLDISTVFDRAQEGQDPLDTLLEAYEEHAEDYPSFGPTLVAALAQVGAAAVLQLGKELNQSPKAVVRGLMEKYFSEADDEG